MARTSTSWLDLLILVAIGMSVGCSDKTSGIEPESFREPVEVSASVDRAVATTGDLITYRISVNHDAGYEVEIPEAGAEIAGFRIVDVGREAPRDVKERVIEERWYQLRADLVGSYVLPPVSLEYRALPADAETAEGGDWLTVATSEIFVEVESVLPTGGEAEDIRGLKPLRQVDRRIPWLWIAVVFLAAALLAWLAWFLWRRRADRLANIPPIPAHELAFKALDELRATDFSDPRAVRRFYFAISEVIRAYLEGRFGLNATDLTTEEILADLPDIGGLPPAQNASLRRFLLDTDQVKFAHHEPDQAEIEITYEAALKLVEETRPRVEQECNELDLEAA